MDDAQKEALASLTGSMFAEPIATGEIVVTDPEPVSQAPVAPVAVQEAPQPPAPPVAPQAVSEAPVAPEEVPNYTFKPNLDEDQRALLDEPDFEEDAAREVAAEVEEGGDEYEYTDPTAAAKQRAADKRIAWLESQLVARSRKGWVEEARRSFPDLARLLPGEIEAISATSRKSFLREANKINDRYNVVLAPTLAKLEAERAAIASGAVAVAREEVANAWGKPAGDSLPPVAAAQQEALEKARKSGNLEDSIKVLMETRQVL